MKFNTLYMTFSVYGFYSGCFRYYIRYITINLIIQNVQVGFRKNRRDFPGGPVAKMLHSQCRGPAFRGLGLIPGWGSKIPHDAAKTKKDPAYCSYNPVQPDK